MTEMCGAVRTKKYDIPLSHLDFKYIDDCSDVKELEKILKVLRSGEEGRYLDLEKSCEKKLTELNPKSKVLRKDNPTARPEDFDRDEWEIIDGGLKEWTEEMKELEKSVKTGGELSTDDLPPVRGSSVQVNTQIKNKTEEKPRGNKNVKPRDYREWDKFDIDKELKSVDEDSIKASSVPNTLRQTSLPQNLRTDVDLTGLTEEEKSMKANREKDKGNEAFRSNDHVEAVVYYTRSINYVPLPASYNNRALAYLKLSKWPEAISDCNRVLTEEPDNVKAILRRGTAYKGMKDYKKAQRDFERVLELESNNKRAKDLLKEMEKQKGKEEEEKLERKKKGRRMMIEEVEGSDSEDEKSSKIVELNSEQLENVDKDSQDRVKDECTESAIVNGHSEDPQEKLEDGLSEEITVRDAVEENSSLEKSESGIKNDETSENVGKSEEVTEEVKSCETLPNEEVVNVKTRPVFTQNPLPEAVGKLREDGNGLFRSGQYGDALEKYTAAIEALIKDDGDQRVNLSLLYSNRAASRLKTGDCSGAIEDCTEALRLVPHSVKPLMRRAQANETLERYRQAYVDFKHVTSIDSTFDLAYLGANRSIRMLKDLDGPNWRDKVPELQRVDLTEVPIIENMSLSPSSSSSSLTQSPDLPSPSSTSASAVEEEPKQLTPEEEFDKKKAEGNQLVQKGSFREAEQCYGCCIQLFPDRAVAYTNRALCFLRLNEASKAEEDCTSALTLEAQNVKALFRRAQARKMLGLYKDSLSDLTQLLKLDSKNSAARREMEVVKKYYREELEKLKSSNLASNTAEKKNSPSKKSSTKKKNSSEKDSSSPAQNVGSSGKPRKRVIIEEVEGDESSSSNGDIKITDQSKHSDSTANQTTPTMRGGGDSESKQSPAAGKRSGKADSAGTEETSPPKVRVPKLIKVTPYEFMQAWNSLKSVKATEPYAMLLEQVPPSDIVSVISNKLDADMLTKILNSAAEYFVPQGRTDLAYQFLSNLTKVPRFQTIAMFMSLQEKQGLSSLMDTIEKTHSDVYSSDDLRKLRADYGLKETS